MCACHTFMWPMRSLNPCTGGQKEGAHAHIQFNVRSRCPLWWASVHQRSQGQKRGFRTGSPALDGRCNAHKHHQKAEIGGRFTFSVLLPPPPIPPTIQCHVDSTAALPRTHNNTHRFVCGRIFTPPKRAQQGAHLFVELLHVLVDCFHAADFCSYAWGERAPQLPAAHSRSPTLNNSSHARKRERGRRAAHGAHPRLLPSVSTRTLRHPPTATTTV